MGNIGTYPPQNVSAQTPTLGYAEVTTSQTGITGADKDLTGLAVTITVPAGRRIKVTGFIPQFNRTAGTVNYINLQVMEGTTTKSLVTINPNNLYAGGEVIAVITPSAGSHTYKLQVDLDAAATVDMVVSATEFLAFILVEDITGSQLPVLPQSVPVGVVAQKRTTTISAAYDTWGLITELSMTAPPFVSGRQYEVTVHGFMDASADSEWTLYTWFGEVNAQQLARKKVLAGDIVEFHGGGLFSPVDGGRLAVFAVRQGGTGTLQIGGMDVDHASWVIVKDVTPTPAPGQGAPGSTLGYAEKTANQIITAAGVYQDMTGLSVTVTVPAGRRLRLTAKGGLYNATAGTNQTGSIAIYEGGTLIAVVYSPGNFEATGTYGDGAIGDGSCIITPSAGTHTYKVVADMSVGTANVFTASAGIPAFLLVEDITGAVWPQGSIIQTSGSTLGYAERTTGQTGLTAVAADLTGLSVTVTVGSGRRIRITGHAGFHNLHNSAAANGILTIKEGATTLNDAYEHIQNNGSGIQFGSADASVILSPSAGTHTYKLQGSISTATGNIYADVMEPNYILVEDITGSDVPVVPQSVPVGVIAQAQSFTNVNGIGNTDTVLLSVNISVPAGRTLKVTAGANLTNNTLGGRSLGAIRMDGTAFGRWCDRTSASAGYYESASDSVLISPSAGAHTIDMTMNAIAGTTSIEAASTEPIHLIVEDVTPTPSPAGGAPGSTLGYAEVTANQTGITTLVDLTGLSVTVTVPAGRRLKITGAASGYAVSAANAQTDLEIREGSTTIMAVDTLLGVAGNANNWGPVEAIISPSAGTHVYKLSAAQTVGAGGIVLGATAVKPAFILVEDITGAVWPNGSPVTVGMIASEAWIDYTPAWSSSGTQPSLGNGVMWGRYTKIGRTIHGMFYLNFGSTTSLGTGDYRWSLPILARTGYSWQVIGTAKGWGGGPSLNAIARIYGGDTSYNKFVLNYSATAPAGTETHVGAAAPWTWGTGLDISVVFTYESAS